MHLPPSPQAIIGKLVKSSKMLLIFFFSRELFNKWQAQRWWAENYDKVMELYNVHRFNRRTVPLPIPPRSEDEVSLVV